MATDVTVNITAQDNFSGVLGNFGSIITGIESAIRLAGDAFRVISDVAGQFVTSASESQDSIAELDAVLRSTASAMGVFSETTTVLSEDALAKLEDKLKSATDKLTLMEMRYADAKAPTDAMTFALQLQREKVAALQASLESGNETITRTIEKSQLSREALIGLAEGYQQVTRFSDETILSGESMLLTFTNIGADIFPLATEAMLNLAEKMGSDVAGAAIQLGKALNDPVNGVTALRRVGVQLTETQEDQIKKFVEMGDIMSAQKIILGELEIEFGGLAVAMGDTFAGKLAIAINMFDELKETIGNALLPALSTLLDWFVEFINRPEIQAFVNDFAADLGFAVQQIAQWIMDTFNNPETLTRIQSFIDLITGVSGAFAALVDAGPLSFEFGAALSAIFGEETEQKIFAIQNALKYFFGTIQDAFATGDFSNLLSQITVWLDNLDVALADAIGKVDWTALGAAFGDAMESAILAIGDSGATGSGSQALPAIAKALNEFFLAAVGAVDWKKVGDVVETAVFQIITNVLEGLDIIVNQIDWSPLGEALTVALKEVFVGAADGLLLAMAKSFGDPDIATFQTNVKIGAEKLKNILIGLIFPPAMLFGDVKKEWAGIGMSIWEGIASGLQNMGLTFFADAIRGLIMIAKQVLGIASPSSVFAGIGRDIVYGLLAGIVGGWSSLVTIVAGLVNNLVGTISTAISNALGGGGGSTGVSGTSDLGHSTGSTDGRPMGGTIPSGGGGGMVTNNYYGPVYFQGAGEPGAYYDCPSDVPLTTSSIGLVFHTPGGGR